MAIYGLQKIHFAASQESPVLPRADNLGDRFEGSLSRPCKDRIGDWAASTGTPDRMLGRLSEFLRQDRKRVVVRCWYQLRCESEAMWARYAPGGAGIAIKTGFGSLIGSFQLYGSKNCRNILFGRVRCSDYEKDDMRLFGGMLLFQKRKSFDHEREVCIAKWFDWKKQENSNETDISADVVDGPGIYWPIDIRTLIHKVVVSPFAEEWFVETVSAVTEQLGSSHP